MDDRLKKALEFSNYMITLNNQRKLVHEKFVENCVHYINGGKFNVTKELINFCHVMVSTNQNSIVLIDDNNSPIEIKDPEDFLEEITSIYFTNANEYLVKFNKIKQKRSVEGLLDL
jgi:hypothetical protein|tara:strand:- start:186 stop:533 length:348 start_codon:yes stop_codon:yes gene_type:complete